MMYGVEAAPEKKTAENILSDHLANKYQWNLLRNLGLLSWLRNTGVDSRFELTRMAQHSGSTAFACCSSFGNFRLKPCYYLE